MNEAMARQYLDYNGEMPQTRSVARRHFNTEMPTAEQIKEMEPKVKSYFNNNKNKKRVRSYVETSTAAGHDRDTLIKQAKLGAWRT